MESSRPDLSDGPVTRTDRGSTPESFSDVVALIREDYETHWKDASAPGFRALMVYRVDAWRLTVSRRALRLPLTLLCRTAFRWIRNNHGIEIPPTALIGRRLQIIHWGGIVVHRYATIGDDCTLLHGATIGAYDNVDRESAPRLGNNVQVGAGAMVMGRVTIGDGAKIGPNAIIMTSVPAGATAFATPARMLYPPEPQS